jgi:hypothetical protein
VDFLLRGKGRCVAITCGIGFQQYPSFFDQSIRLLLSVAASGSGIPCANDLNFVEFGEIYLFFLLQSNHLVSIFAYISKKYTIGAVAIIYCKQKGFENEVFSLEFQNCLFF